MDAVFLRMCDVLMHLSVWGCGYFAVNPLRLAAEGGGRGKSLLFDENLPEDDFVIFKDMTTWRDGEMENCKDVWRAAQIMKCADKYLYFHPWRLFWCSRTHEMDFGSEKIYVIHLNLSWYTLFLIIGSYCIFWNRFKPKWNYFDPKWIPKFLLKWWIIPFPCRVGADLEL